MGRQILWLLAGIATLVATASNSAHSQTQPFTPVDPGQSEKRFDAQQERQRLAKPPVVVPNLATAPMNADNRPLFILKGVVISGAISIPDDALRQHFDHLIGRRVSQADLLTITEGMTKSYREAGFHLSRAVIPSQDLKNGRLRVDLIEGFFTELDISGDDKDAFGARKFLEPVLSERPSRRTTLERQLLLINELPGLRVADITMDEVGQATGRFRLNLKLKSWRLYANTSLDNSGTRAVGPLQAYATVAANSTLVAGDSTAVNLSTVPDATRELRYGRLSYDTPIGSDGVKLGGSISRSEVWPGDNRRLIEDRTISQGYELRGSFTPVQTRKLAVIVTASANWSDPYETTSFGDVYRDHVRQVSVAVDVKFQDELNAWNYFGLAVRQGVNAFGASTYGDPDASRGDASPIATVVAYSFARYQPLLDAWSLKAAFSGQFASGPLLTSQSYFLGGAAFGPGYFSGDHGYSGSLELRFDQTADLPFLKGYQLYAFMDGGQVWNSHEPTLSLASAGIGWRALLSDELTASVALAMPVHYTYRSEEIGRARILFSVSSALKWCPNAASFYCA